MISLLHDLLDNRKLIWNLAKNDFKTRFSGSYLGVFWAFVPPVVTTLVYWFVFQVGFRTASANDYPYILMLITGLVPWFYLSEAWVGGTSSLLEYSYLVKKVVFQINILPNIKLLSALFVHFFFIGVAVIICVAYGFYPTIYMIQLLYYTFALFVFLTGCTYITSAVIVFFRDLGQIINILLQVGIWLSPIMWNEAQMPQKYIMILKLNPMYYIIQGYRDMFLEKTWFFEHVHMTIYFWGVTVGLLIAGTSLFKRLKPHFADLL